LNLFVFGLLFGVLGAWRRVELAKSWIETTGRVEAVEPGKHNSITVRYTVGAQVIETNFSRSTKTVGDAINVYYSPKDPSLSDIENPEDSIRRDTRFWELACLALGTFAAISIHFRAIGLALSWPWTKIRSTPRTIVSWTAIGVVAGTVAGAFSVRAGVRLWLADVFMLGGITLLCIRAFRVAPGVAWIVFVRSKMILVGAVLLLIGSLIGWRVFN
jgi:hypothetical protein